MNARINANFDTPHFISTHAIDLIIINIQVCCSINNFIMSLIFLRTNIYITSLISLLTH